MEFDTNNTIIRLCAEGMQLEGEGKNAEATQRFLQAWQEATTDFEKFTAAHYVARHQNSVADKLNWDTKALEHALNIKDEGMKAHYPSLYLNIAKCHEDLGDFNHAEEFYRLGMSFVEFLPEDGYGTMIKRGLLNGLERLERKG